MSEKKERLLTPIGEAKWAHIQVPKAPFKDEAGNVKGDPKYQIDVVFDGEDPEWKVWASALQAELRALPQRKNKQGEDIKKWPSIKKELNENDEPTGRFYVTFKTGTQYKPGLFDKFGNPFPADVLVGNGSKVRISYTKKPYEAALGDGVALYLSAVQVITLVEYGNRTAESFGFSIEEAPPQDFDQVNEAPADDSDLPF